MQRILESNDHRDVIDINKIKNIFRHKGKVPQSIIGKKIRKLRKKGLTQE